MFTFYSLFPVEYLSKHCHYEQLYHTSVFLRTASVPKIIHGINNIVVNRGKSFNLTCEFSGQPRMEVTWQKNGNPLSTTDTVSISNMDSNTIYKTSLNFKTINMGENGNTYSCTANYPGVNVRAISTALIKVDGMSTLKFILQFSVVCILLI